MFADHKSTNRLLALVTFIASLVLYCITIAPTASFWDSGEFIAVAEGLQVNHPPGAPFYELLGRLFSMFMPSLWVAVSINFISALSSALTVMLLYLIVVRLIREWKGHPDEMSLIDKIGMYGGAFIGAAAFSVSDTFWFNAVEAEVYASSMFFTAIVVWLALKWADQHDQPNNEKWLVLISFMFGLALGVHLLNLLALFFVALIIYFRKYEFGWLSFIGAGVLSSITFLTIYPFTVKNLVAYIDDISNATYGLLGPIAYLVFIGAVVIGAIYYTHQKKYRLANIILISYAMILIGYSAYSLIFIRSIADPPIDENDPETVEAFESYLKREQYGTTPLLTGPSFNDSEGRVDRSEEKLFPRRYSTSPQHQRFYARYDSDLSYFLDYQVNHMYWRYFAWNFIGRDADIQDATWQGGFTTTEHENNPAHNTYFYLPFLLGVFGMIFHFQKDWKRALSVLALFIMTGLAIIFYLNQTPYQPRERDYAYVGSFFAFSIWIGLGASGLIELIKDYLKSSQAIAYGTLVVTFLAVPFIMGIENFNDHDRSGRYVAPDYAYNLLNSVAPNAILFTNGDNDTFPLWYLQEVEGIRTDVRIVCLSLLNTDWYIKQLKNQWSHESAPIKLSYTDEEIENLEDKFNFNSPDDFWEPKTIRVPVDKEKLNKAYSDSTYFRDQIGVESDTALNVWDRTKTHYQMPIESLDDTVSWHFEGNYLTQDRQGNKLYYTRIQDDMILDIIKQNDWVRPIYFATTVSHDSQMNLQNYFRLEGQAFRLVPQRHENVSFGFIEPWLHADRLEKFRYRNMDNPDVYFDENIRRMLDNYRFAFTQLVDSYMQEGKQDSARYWLDFSREKIPFTNIRGDMTTLVSYAYRYAQIGDFDSAMELADLAKGDLMEELTDKMGRFDNIESRMTELSTQAKSARQNAELSTSQKLRNQMQDVASERKNLVRDLMFNANRLKVVQRIYYMAEKTDLAQSVSDTVNSLTGGRIPFPSSEEANKQQVERFYN